VLQIGRSLVRSQLVSLELFIDIKSFRSHYGPGIDSASNRNEYQEHFLGVKVAGGKGWQTYHIPVPLSWNLGTLASWNPLGHSMPVTGLLYFTFYVWLKWCLNEFNVLIKYFRRVKDVQSSPYAWLCNWSVSVKFLASLQQSSTHTHTHTHTHTRRSSSSFIVTLSPIRRTACSPAQFSGCSSTTNSHSETGQIAVCCQNLTLGALSSRSALSALGGAVFKKFVLFLNTTRTCE